MLTKHEKESTLHRDNVEKLKQQQREREAIEQRDRDSIYGAGRVITATALNTDTEQKGKADASEVVDGPHESQEKRVDDVHGLKDDNSAQRMMISDNDSEVETEDEEEKERACQLLLILTQMADCSANYRALCRLLGDTLESLSEETMRGKKKRHRSEEDEEYLSDSTQVSSIIESR